MREFWFQYEMCRLKGYGRVEGFVCVAAHMLVGTKLYWYPWKERRRIRHERLKAQSSAGKV